MVAHVGVLGFAACLLPLENVIGVIFQERLIEQALGLRAHGVACAKEGRGWDRKEG